MNEEINRLIIFLAAIAQVSLIVKGPSAAGKSELVRTSILLLSPERLMLRASLSKKAPVHGQGSVEGMILYLSEQVGAREANLLLRLQQSEGQIDHEYTTVKGSERSTVTVTRTGKLTIFTTTTQPKLYVDAETRALSLWIDTSSEQTRAIIRAKLAPPRPEEEPPIEVFQEAFRIITADPVTFAYPTWFEYVVRKLPADLRVRRDWPRFQSFCQAIALCRRFTTGQQDEGRREITFPDYCVAYRLLNAIFTSTLRSMPQQEIEIAVSVRKLHARKKRPVKVCEIAEDLGWNLATFRRKIGF